MSRFLVLYQVAADIKKKMHYHQVTVTVNGLLVRDLV